MANAYALGRNESLSPGAPIYADQQTAAYTVPGLSIENGYIDSPASSGTGRTQHGHSSLYDLPVAGPNYAVHATDGQGSMEDFSFSPTDVPDASRIQAIPLYDRHNNTGSDVYGGEFGMQGTPSKERSAKGGEELSATEYNTQIRTFPGDRRWAPNPRLNPPDEHVGGRRHPAPYHFMRPYDQWNRPMEDRVVGSSRSLNGLHFSMADHRRTYDILGMAPSGRTMRNTYRVEPEPWDQGQVDMPPPYSQAGVRIDTVEVPGSVRTYRLVG